MAIILTDDEVLALGKLFAAGVFHSPTPLAPEDVKALSDVRDRVIRRARTMGRLFPADIERLYGDDQGNVILRRLGDMPHGGWTSDQVEAARAPQVVSFVRGIGPVDRRTDPPSAA